MLENLKKPTKQDESSYFYCNNFYFKRLVQLKFKGIKSFWHAV